MPVTMRELGAAVEGGGADFFLHVQTKRAGKVKGESTSPGHADDIIVTGWAWGSYSALTVHKQVDSTTTALMSALVTNDEVKEAKLSLRRAGGEQEDYLVITLKAARITSLQHSGADDGSTRETLTIAFTEVEVQYRPQQSSGVRGGTFVFNDTLPSRA
jgi:type VI secretion system secreted protein Hcp